RRIIMLNKFKRNSLRYSAIGLGILAIGAGVGLTSMSPKIKAMDAESAEQQQLEQELSRLYDENHLAQNGEEGRAEFIKSISQMFEHPELKQAIRDNNLLQLRDLLLPHMETHPNLVNKCLFWASFQGKIDIV